MPPRRKGVIFTAVILATIVLPVGATASSGFNYTNSMSIGSSGASACVRYIDSVLQHKAPLSPAQANSMIQTAESSSAYEALEASGQTVSLAVPSPVEDYAIQYSTSNDCSTITITGYSFNFIAGNLQIAILVNPQINGVVSSQVVPRVKWAAGNQSSGNWFGYGFWEGGTYSNPTTPYDYVLGTFSAPSVYYSYPCGSICPAQMTMGIWSGLTNIWKGQYIAQTGVAWSEPLTGPPGPGDLWTEFLPANPTYCNVAVSSGDSISTETYSGAYNGGYSYYYNVNTYDSTAQGGCSYYNYNWSSGLGSNSYFALLMGENQQATPMQFTTTTITGTIYDINGGPSGNCIYTPYHNNYWESFYMTYNGYSASETHVTTSCTFQFEE